MLQEMGEQDYTAIYPTASAAVDERVKAFIAAFYAVSDNPRKNQEWLDYFAPDACIVMGNRRAQGVEGMDNPKLGLNADGLCYKRFENYVRACGITVSCLGNSTSHLVSFFFLLFLLINLVLSQSSREHISWTKYSPPCSNSLTTKGDSSTCYMA